MIETKQRRARDRLLLAALALAVFGLGACNTVRGAGQDIQSVGEATEDTAEKTGAEPDADSPPPPN